MIEVEHLSKSYGSTPAIADVTFKVEAGEILGFLGPNGAGKTTTMRILTGYLPASSGTARIAGYDVGENSMAVRSRIGYLPEIPPLYPDMTVEGFLNFVAQIKGLKKIDRARRVNLVLERCHLSEKRRVLICKLSRGFKQRVGIAQAIVHDPPAIILDEPTVGLDPKQIIEVRNLIKSLAGEHTIILSTHILPEASMTCDRVAIIDRGQIVATNTPEKLMSDLTGGVNYELEVEGDENAIAPILQSLPGVGSVESIAGRDVLANRTLIHLKATAGMEPGADIAAAIVSQGWKLHEMRKTVVSLEDVFLELTTEEKTLEDSPGD
jgi:ABC-2 type transport system ATP-binding protein